MPTIDIKKLKSALNNLIVNDLDKTFDAISNIINPDSSLANDLILLQSRHNRNKREANMGLNSSSNLDIQFNRITASLTNVIQEIKEKDLIATEIAKIDDLQDCVSSASPPIVDNPTVNSTSFSKPSTAKTNTPVKLFISYAHRDEDYKDELIISLKPMQRRGSIATWVDRKIQPGQDWDESIKYELENADYIIFLVSRYFLASDYIHDVEIKKALERQERKEVIIIPIIVSPCEFQDEPFAKFQALPKNAKAISTWDNVDAAYTDIVKQLGEIFIRRG